MKKLMVCIVIMSLLQLAQFNSICQNIVYLTSPPPSSRTLENTKAVGSLPGTIDVNPIGAATYLIPIDLPPGTAGMTPKLSLQYNSMAGNGILGMGWNIGGISSISRIGQDRFNEGDITAVGYISDRLTLDGQRLILKSGTWFANGSEYRTQNESFSRITYNGTYFKVLTPSGDSIYYGATPESRFKLDPSRVLTWYITRMADPFGNSIIFTYKITEDNFEYLIDKIEYTKTPSFVAYNTIQFNYEKGRADYMMAYKAGIEFNGDYILKSISVKANGTEIKNLTFRYFKNTNNDSYLSYIENTGINNLKTNTTQINWINRPVTVFSQKQFIDYEDDADVTDCTAKEINIEITRIGKKVSYTVLDADGDGKSDVLTLPATGNPSNNLILRYNGLASSYVMPMPTGYKNAIAIDYNGDGMDEIMFHKGTNPSYGTGFSLNSKLTYYGADAINGSDLQFSIWKFSISTNRLEQISPGSNNYGISGLLNLQYKLYQADMDGNGMTDLIFANHSTNSIYYQVYLAEVVSGSIAFVKRAEGTFTMGGTLYTIDFNGDGKQELICSNGIGVYINYFSKIQGQANYSFGSWQVIRYTSTSVLKLSFGDLNGDNKVDILDSINCKEYFSTGLNSSPYVKEVTYTSAKNRFIGADYNADGKNEIMSQSISPAFVHQLTNYYITGETTTNNQQLYNYCRLHQLLFGDFNGDGIMEKLLFHAGVNKSTLYNYNHILLYLTAAPITIERQNMVAGSILDGLNSKTEMTYAVTTSPAVYSKNEVSVLTSPIRVINPKLIVVKDLKTDDGINGQTVTSWLYENARVHIDGKGLLGYGKITVTNSTTGFKNISAYGFDNTFYEPLLSTTKVATVVTSKNISGSNFAYKNYSYGTNGQKHYLIYPDTTAEYDYLKMQKVKTTLIYTTNDLLNHGNWSSATKKYFNIAQAPQENASVAINNSYSAFYNNKLYRVTTTTIDKTRPGETTDKSKRNFIYWNDLSTRINKDIIYYYTSTGAEDADKDTLTYDYNTFGNVTQVKTQLGNIQRTTSSGYDSKYRFRTSATNALGYSSNTAYYDQGLVQSQTDPNNLVKTYTYDGLGNLTNINNPDAADETDSIKWVKPNDPAAPLYSLYYQKVQVKNETYIKTYFNKIGQVLRTVSPAQNGRLVYTDITYNNKGQQVQASLPYFPGDTIHWNYYTYYDDGRIQTSYIDNNVKKVTFTFDKNKVTQTMNNTGQVFTRTYDAAGALISATDPGGSINYNYYSSGNLKNVIAPSCTTSCEYDKYDTQKKLIDPNAGTTQFEYNAYGELVYQQDNKGNWFRITKIDKAGRPLIKTLSDGSTVTFTYDADFKGALYNVSHSNGTSSQYIHNSLGLVTKQKETIQGLLYETNYDYNSYSKISKVTYPSALAISYTYDINNGYLTQVNRSDISTLLWSAGDVNAYGEWKNFTLGSAINRQMYWNKWGMPSKITTGSVQSLQYSFNTETGNLNCRKDLLKSLTETFTYNTTLDQLTSWKIGSTTYSISYKNDGTSRMDTKTDAGTFVYGSAPAIHKVTGLNSNPGTISNTPQTINYTSFNKIDSIFETGAYRLKYKYGADEQRRVSRLYNNSYVKVKEIIYVPGGYEVEKIGNVTRKMHYIPVGDCWALFVKNSAGQDSLYFLLTDHLGSVNVITNSVGTKLKEYSFDPWGRRRNPSDWTYNNVPGITITTRGFTMHEHMDKFNLINMNGRVYDPVMGQFLSADPFISNPGSTTGFNRYSYCQGNPLKRIDPSGYNDFTHYKDIDRNGGGTWSIMNYANFGYQDITIDAGPGFEDLFTYMTGTNGSAWVKNSTISNVFSNGTWNPGEVAELVNSGGAGLLLNGLMPIFNTSQSGYSQAIFENANMWVSITTNPTTNKSYVYIDITPLKANNRVASGGGGGLTVADWTNNGIGGLGTGMRNVGGNFRINNFNGFSPKFYTKLNAAGKIFNGGFGIKTYNTTNWGKGIGYGSLGVSFVIGGINVTNGWQQDGHTYGANTQMALAQSSLGITGAWSGAEILGAVGFLIAPELAIPLAIIGGVGGGYGGSKLGETIVDWFK